MTIRCTALPDRLAQLLDAHPYQVRNFLNELKCKGRKKEDEENEEEEQGTYEMGKEEDKDDGVAGCPSLLNLSINSGGEESRGGARGDAKPFRKQMEEAFQENIEKYLGDIGQASSTCDLSSVLAFGPRNVGPNILIKSKSFSVRFLWGRAKEEEQQQEEETPGHDVKITEDTEEWLSATAWSSLENSIMVGFQMATSSGACFS